MKINADFEKRVLVKSRETEWQASPMAGVWRRPLDRVGGEVARATSIVRYDPKSHFSPHIHNGGEEFIVLDGVFQDEHGDFPAGSYIRNPPQSRHRPGSEPGCIIFVKLWQFVPEDRVHVNISIDRMRALDVAGQAGTSIVPLYHDQYEDVSIVRLQPHARYILPSQNGTELLVLDGGLSEGEDILGKHDWLRLPVGEPLNISAGGDGAKIWLKTGHLASVNAQIERVQAA